ncbi:MAG: cytochrome c3 family protein [Planctomycetota bacterium]|jgi:predicted CXXCH cytochrome family protein
MNASEIPLRRARRALLLVVLIGSLAVMGSFTPGCGSSGRGPVRRPGPARGCADCHEPFMQALSEQQPHFAGMATRCEDCHDRHGLVGVLKLKSEETELCLSCHTESAHLAEAPNAHSAITAGGCSDCHDPHGSTGGTALLRAEGPALCYECHEAEAFQGAVGHDPSKQDCLACHDAHVNATPEGLNAEVPGLCTSCHAQGDGAFVAAHEGYDVARSDCSACHTPHASSEAGLMRPVLHSPMADRDCASCHVEPEEASPTAAGPETLIETAQLCTLCHGAEIEEFHAAAAPHAVVTDGDCLSCHNAHGSEHAGLLTAPADDGTLCAACHSTSQEVAELVSLDGLVHAPVAAGSCLDCHDPHGGQGAAVLVTDEPDLCLECHVDVVEHYDREVVHAPLDMCTLCHAGHGSRHIGMLKESPGDLCLSCHTETEERMRHEDIHRPVSLGQCLVCHDPHASDFEATLRKEPAALCLDCHADVQTNVTGGSQHAPVGKGECLECHQPHSAPGPGLLVTESNQLCASCHGMTAQAVEDAAFKHPPAEAGACLACHEPHHAPREALLSNEPRTLCLSCHGNVMTEMNRPGHVSHFPAAAGECLDCHEPHASDHAGLSTLPSPDLCWSCHDADDEAMSDAHLGLAGPDSDCTSCHAPHSGERGLFWPNRHEPFNEMKCDECHASK